MRSIFLVLGILASLPLTADSANNVSAKLSTGFLPQPVEGHFWAMASSYRAAFSPHGIRLVRHGRHAQVRFPGATLRWQADGEPLGQVNFLGADSRSHQGTSALRAPNAYPGIDIVLRINDGRLKSEFQLAPGASPSRTGYCVDGAKIRLGGQGNSIEFDAGDGWHWSEEGLVSWQTSPSGAHLPVPAKFAVHGSCVRFQLDAFDPALPLTIDPDLVFSSYMGGGLFDAITAIATDSQGNSYLGGWTESSDFPSLTGYQSVSAGRIDGFIAKVNSSGQLQYATYLGGASEDRVQALAVNASGVVTVAGYTSSTNFPTLAAARGTLAGGRDGFVTRIAAAGNTLVFSTYLGGAGNDAALGIALDLSGNIIVVGETASTDFPTQSAMIYSAPGGVDGFISRFNTTGTLLSSTYFGGSGDDRIRAVAVGSDGLVHFTGATSSSNFPVSSAPYPTLRGSMDGFYTRCSATVSILSISTYLGGSGGNSLNEEGGYGIAVDSLSRVWIAGVTPSTDFPGVALGNQTTYGGGVSDAFVSVFTAAGALEWSTFIGGTGLDAATSIAAGSGFVGLAGYTTSINLPVSGALQSTRAGDYDAFWAAFPIVSNKPLYISYLGGAGSDSALASAASGSTLSVAGSTLSANFPLVSATQTSNPGGYGGFVSRVRFGPGPLSVSPSTGTGLTQTFQFTISHANGSASLNNAAVLFNTTSSLVNGCYFSLDKTANTISLYKDAGSLWLTATVGSATVLDNGVCSAPAASVTVSTNANSLLLSLPVTFAAGFAGTKNIYANSTDTAGLGAAWPLIGDWRVDPPAAPTVTSVSPASGSGPAQAFTFLFNDTNGATDISTAIALVNSSLSNANGCYLVFDRAANTVALFNDAGSNYLTLTLGTATTIENANCSITGTGATATLAGNQLTLVLPIVFKSGFTGPRTIFAYASDAGNLASGWQTVGSWTPASNSAPTVVNVAPPAGSGASQTFTLTVADANGATDIASAALLFNAAASTANGCYIVFNRQANTLSLFNDATSSFLNVTLGVATVIENTNCSITGTGASVTLSGTQLLLAVPVVFKPPFIGLHTVYAAVSDVGGLASGWQTAGTWTPFANVSPTVTSIAPGAGSGQSQTFTLTVADANGATDIATAAVLFNTSLGITNGCYFIFDRAANTVSLFNDAGSNFLPVTPGAATTVQNTNCSITGAGLSVTLTATQVILAVPITFKTSFTGPRNIYAAVTDNASLSSGWQAAGTWTPVSNATPSLISVTPSSGNGQAQTFTVIVADSNGATDITTASLLFSTSLSTANACYLLFDRAANTISLFNDAGSSFLSVTPGASTTIENAACSITGSGATITASGSQLTLAVPVTFKPSFTGIRNIFASVSDSTSLTTGWQAAGTWTPATNYTPALISVSPSSGAGPAQTFTVVVADANGAADIATASFLFNTTPVPSNACYITYFKSTNQFSLFRDSDGSMQPIAPGAAGMVENANCQLSGFGLSVTGTGNQLTFTLPVSFKPAFSGYKNFYAGASDAAGTTSGWQSFGGWSPDTNAAPTVTSVTPSTGNGLVQNFSFVLSDANGFGDIISGVFLFNNVISGNNACYLFYSRPANLVYLFRDADGSWLSLSPGSSATVSNSICSLSGAGLTVTGSGNALTIVLPITFQSSFTGLKNIYANATDQANLPSGWVTLGSWTPVSPAAAPTVASLSPNSGAGASQVFTLQFADPNGASDIASAVILINNAINGNNGCYISVNRGGNLLYLFQDSTNSWLPISPGSATPVANANCSLSGSGLTFSSTGTTFTVTLPLTFSAAFTGTRNFYASVTDAGGLTSGWVTAGTWTTAGSPAPPTVTSVSPNAGSGGTQTFTLTLADPNGNQDIAGALIIINSAINGNNGCFLSYSRSANTIFLFRDADNSWQPLTPGAASSVSNANCSLAGAGFTVTASGSNLVLALPFTFTAQFSGTKTFYASVVDQGNLSSGWITAGTWNPSGTPAPPVVTSVSPNSGSGTSQTFTVTLSDANGNTDIAGAVFIINSAIDGTNSCFFSYSRSANSLYLYRDSDGAWLPLTSGSNATVANAKCTIAGAGFAVTGSGNTLTIAVPITFSAAFAGLKNFYVSASDYGSLNSGWVTAGSWNTSAVTPAPPTVTSVTPASGAGSSQTFTVTLSDPNGNADIGGALIIINNAINGNNACFMAYSRSANAIYLFRDSDNTWLPLSPGVATTVSNNNCTLSGASFTVSGSGNNLVLAVPITFKPAFAGARSIYVSASDAGNLSSGWITAGSWTVN